MGHATLYHPVSLHVIRGGFEYCSWRVGKIRQVSNDREKCTAKYVCTIDQVPNDCRDLNIKNWPPRMSRCFAADVNITAVWINRAGVTFCEVVTAALPEDQTFGVQI